MRNKIHIIVRSYDHRRNKTPRISYNLFANDEFVGYIKSFDESQEINKEFYVHVYVC